MHITLMPTLATHTQKSCECISRWQADRVGWIYNQQGQSLSSVSFVCLVLSSLCVNVCASAKLWNKHLQLLVGIQNNRWKTFTVGLTGYAISKASVFDLATCCCVCWCDSGWCWWCIAPLNSWYHCDHVLFLMAYIYGLGLCTLSLEKKTTFKNAFYRLAAVDFSWHNSGVCV